MSGADFVAVVRLSDKANKTLAQPGETCARVPASSLEWLERSGKIRRSVQARPSIGKASRQKDED